MALGLGSKRQAPFSIQSQAGQSLHAYASLCPLICKAVNFKIKTEYGHRREGHIIGPPHFFSPQTVDFRIFPLVQLQYQKTHKLGVKY